LQAALGIEFAKQIADYNEVVRREFRNLSMKPFKIPDQITPRDFTASLRAYYEWQSASPGDAEVCDTVPTTLTKHLLEGARIEKYVDHGYC
jgi:hypothetical protein